MNKLINFFLLLLISQVSFGQVSSCLSVPPKKLCVGESITVTNCIVPKGNIPGVGEVDFGDNSPKVQIPENGSANHAYSTPGNKKIVFRGGFENGGIDDTIIIVTVIDPEPLPYRVLNCIDGQTLFQLEQPSYDLYFVKPDPSVTESPMSIDNMSGIQSYVYNYPDTIPKVASVRSECGAAVNKTVRPIGKVYKPQIEFIETISNGVEDFIQIKFHGLNHLKYHVIVDTVNGTLRDLITNVPADTIYTYPLWNNNACVQIIASDDCDHKDSSQLVCISKVNATAGENKNIITWDSIPYISGDLKEYEVFRDGISLGKIPASKRQYIDSSVSCGTTYAYSIKNIKSRPNGEGTTIYGLSIPVTVLSSSTTTPPSVREFYSNIEGASVKLYWKAASGPVKSYEIRRSVNNSTFEKIAEVVNPTFSDDNYPPGNLLYQIVYKDSCDLDSELSAIISPAIGQAEKNDNDRIKISFSRYRSSFGGSVSYELEKLDNNDQVIGAIPLGTDTVFNDTANYEKRADIRYRIKVTDTGNPGKIIYSNIIIVNNDLVIYAPNAFTPNGDEQNENFRVYGKHFTDFSISIFNRWGELVYYSTDILKGWDGNFKNEDCEPGNYIYIVSVKNIAGKEATKKGSFLLLR